MKIKCSLKKLFVFLVTCVLISALFCLPVSAFATGGATITITNAWYTGWGSNVNLTYGEVSERDDGYFWHLEMDNILNTGTIYGDVQVFSFSASNNYGTLVVKYRQSFGTAYNTVYNRLYNADTDTNLGATLSISSNIITLTYTGYIPSSIRLATYFTLTGSTGSSLTSFSFTPIDKATQDIIDNQNKTASDIQANQDKNTSDILNGWDSDASPDDNTTSDYSDIEQSLIDDTQDNADNANVEVNDNFIGSLQRYVSGFGAVSQMFSDLLLVQVPDVNGIVWFSLAMGVVPLIVGLTIKGLRSSDRSAARDRYNSVGGRSRKY